MSKILRESAPREAAASRRARCGCGPSGLNTMGENPSPLKESNKNSKIKGISKHLHRRKGRHLEEGGENEVNTTDAASRVLRPLYTKVVMKGVGFAAP